MAPDTEGVGVKTVTSADYLTDHLLAALFWARQLDDRVAENGITIVLDHIARGFESYEDEGFDR